MSRMPESAGTICSVPGLQVGHYTNSRRPTGCTVILIPDGAAAGVEVRGSAPGTRETDLLNPINTVEKVHSVLLTGGSAFGLDAASGVMQYLEERGIGLETPAGKIPIVCAAVLYDLGLGDAKIRPDRIAGYQACLNASTSPPAEGNVGAGSGATVGKLFGLSRAMKAGIGTVCLESGSLQVGALVALNAWGDVLDPETGKLLAGARSPDGREMAGTRDIILQGSGSSNFFGSQNTTLGVVATNATLNKAQATKVAQMAQDGLARAINPAHTPVDGDTIFALSTGELPESSDILQIGVMAAEAMVRAILRALFLAKGIPGIPAYGDLFP